MGILDDYALLYRTAHYYYINEYSQVEISKMEHLSKPQVSRLISRAKELGMVRIEVTPFQDPHYIPLETSLKQYLGLKEVRVFPSDEPDNESRFISAAASWLSHELVGCKKTGIAWGQTIYRVSLRLIPEKGDQDMLFVPLLGNTGISTAWLQANSILDRYAANFSAKAVFTQCSLITPKSEISNKLEAQRLSLLEESWEGIDAAVMGIGGKPDFSRGFLAELDPELQDDLIRAGPAGDLYGHFFNEDGELYKVPDTYHLASLPLEKLKQVPRVICLAAGSEKADAIRIAAGQNWFTELITDETTAEAILNTDRKSIIEGRRVKP